MSLVYQFVCVLFPFFDFFFFGFWLGSGGCEITGTTQLLLSRISHDHLSRLLKKKKRVNICIFLLPKGARGAEKWECGWLGGGLTCEYTLH